MKHQRRPHAFLARTVAVALLALALLAGFAGAARLYAGRAPDPDPAIARASTVVPIPSVGLATGLPAPHGAAGTISVDTAQYGTARLGWNRSERTLTTANVNPRSFGKLFEVRLDGTMYAQPLIAAGVEVPGRGVHDLLIAATEQDSVYAFDAQTGAPLWHHTFTGCCGVTAVPAKRTPAACPQIPFIGVSSTPVIDPRTQTVYVVAKTMATHDGRTTFHNTLHALSLATGTDRSPPAAIAGRVDLSFDGAFARGQSWKHALKRVLLGGSLRFDDEAQFNRPGLLLANGNVYVAFASHCDVESAHGWIFAYDARTLAPVSAFSTINGWHDDNGGGIWQSGFGLTADASGNIYFTTGNGPFDADRGGRDYGDSLLKLSPDLHRVLDYFTPYTQSELEQSDSDFGGGGMIALPDGAGRYPHLAVVSSKIRALFLLDRDDLGGYTRGGPDRTLQTIGDDHGGSRWCIGTCGGPAYYAVPGGEYIANIWAIDALRLYRLDRSGPRPRLVEVAHSPNTFPGFGGSTPTVSSDGLRPGSAIVWATTRPYERDQAKQPIELYAYDASNVSRVLYHGDVSLWHNPFGAAFLTPTVANGKVYVGGYDRIAVFGLLPVDGAVARR